MTQRPLTEKGRQALEKALHVPLARNEDGELPFRQSVLATLVRRGLLAFDGDTWAITSAGKAALLREIPRFLHAKVPRGYTTNPALAAKGEPEAVDDTTLDVFCRHADQQRARSLADRQRAVEELRLSERVARLEAEAAAAGVDIRRKMAKVQETIRAAERQLRRDSAA